MKITKFAGLKRGFNSLLQRVFMNAECWQARYYSPNGALEGDKGSTSGTIRQSGGGLGKYGAAQEEGYFYNKTKEQLEKLKQKLKSEPEKSPNIKPKGEEK